MQNIRNRLPTIFHLLLIVWLAVYCFKTASLIVDAYNPLPEMDYWETVPHLERYLHFPPAVLWEQHYEHRVVVPELVFAVDWLFLKGRELLPLVLISVLDVAFWVLLVFTYRQSGGRKKSFAPVLAGIVLAWPGVAFVLAFRFLSNFFCINLV